MELSPRTPQTYLCGSRVVITHMWSIFEWISCGLLQTNLVLLPCSREFNVCHYWRTEIYHKSSVLCCSLLLRLESIKPSDLLQPYIEAWFYWSRHSLDLFIAVSGQGYSYRILTYFMQWTSIKISDYLLFTDAWTKLSN